MYWNLKRQVIWSITKTIVIKQLIIHLFIDQHPYRIFYQIPSYRMSLNNKNIELPSISSPSARQVQHHKSSINQKAKFTLLKNKNKAAFKRSSVAEIAESFHKKVEQAKQICKRIHNVLNSSPQEMLLNQTNKKQISAIKKTQISPRGMRQTECLILEGREDYRKQISRNMQWAGGTAFPIIRNHKVKNKKFFVRQQTDDLISLIQPTFHLNSQNLKSSKKFLALSLRVKQLIKTKQDFKQNDGVILYDKHKQMKTVQIKERFKQWKKKDIQIMRM